MQLVPEVVHCSLAAVHITLHFPTPPPLCLQVVAAHPYTGEDDDELSFEKGEVICVIPFEDPDYQVRSVSPLLPFCWKVTPTSVHSGASPLQLCFLGREGPLVHGRAKKNIS